jgi:hypothetical protein
METKSIVEIDFKSIKVRLIEINGFVVNYIVGNI